MCQVYPLFLAIVSIVKTLELFASLPQPGCSGNWSAVWACWKPLFTIWRNAVSHLQWENVFMVVLFSLSSSTKASGTRCSHRALMRNSHRVCDKEQCWSVALLVIVAVVDARLPGPGLAVKKAVDIEVRTT